MSYKDINRKYLLAFISIVLLTALGQAIVQYVIYKQRSYSKVINLAGKQRMRAQRLMKLVLLETKGLNLNSEILELKEEMSSTHQILLNGSKDTVPAFTSEIRGEYLKLGSMLRHINPKIDCFIEKCESSNLFFIELNNDLERFLVKMDYVVGKSEEFAKKSIIELAWLEILIFVFIIFLFTYEFFKIILPLKSYLLNQIKKLEEQDKQIIHQARLASIGQLAAGVGHEINNPLSIAVGNIEILQRKARKGESLDDPKLLEKIEKVSIAHKRIRDIVDGLRVFARTDSDHLEVVSLNKMITESIQLIKEIYEKEGVKLSYESVELEYYVEGKFGQLQQVLMNLLSNAKDATEGQEKREININLKSLDSRVLFSVRDNGAGMSKEVQEKILLPFFTTKDIGKGTGLGLSLVMEMVKRMNGEISVESELGKGAIFTVSFDMLEGKTEKEKNKKELTKEKSLSGSALVVDDEEEIRELIVNLLKEVGLKAVGVESGELALAQMDEEKFDFICTDIKMPKMSGDEFIKLAKKHKNGDCKYFVISGAVSENFRSEEVKLSGVDGYLEKPFTQDSLISMLSA